MSYDDVIIRHVVVNRLSSKKYHFFLKNAKISSISATKLHVGNDLLIMTSL